MADLTGLIPKLAGQRILVVGDVILDEYLTGRATRMSREAPVPVLELEARHVLPGGAANPAANIAALGSTASLVGVVGADPAAETLRQVLNTRGISAHLLLDDATRPTTVKMRIMAQMGLRFPQQVARLDTLSREPISPEIERQVGVVIAAEMRRANAVLVSDYHTGLLTTSLVSSVRTMAGNAGSILLAADAQGSLEKYVGFALVKCNADEARAYLGRDLRTDRDFATAAFDLCSGLQLTGAMFITRGADGITWATGDGTVSHARAPAVTDVYDTVGAGDTAIAVITLAVGAGATYAEAAALANYGSGLVVRRVGNYTPAREELLWALETWRSEE
ncbi:MAG: ribokinase [Chloroflexi bacterium]|nr:ribokinase [Chloroflexota bacterium]